MGLYKPSCHWFQYYLSATVFGAENPVVELLSRAPMLVNQSIDDIEKSQSKKKKIQYLNTILDEIMPLG